MLKPKNPAQASPKKIIYKTEQKKILLKISKLNKQNIYIYLGPHILENMLTFKEIFPRVYFRSCSYFMSLKMYLWISTLKSLAAPSSSRRLVIGWSFCLSVCLGPLGKVNLNKSSRESESDSSDSYCSDSSEREK